MKPEKQLFFIKEFDEILSNKKNEIFQLASNLDE